MSRLEPSEKIPAELREIYAHLAGDLIDTLGVLKELRILYSTSEEAINLMKRVADTFFARHERLLIDHIILFVSRATDERKSGPRNNRQENLTLDCLLDLPNPEPRKTADRSAEEMDRNQIGCEADAAIPAQAVRARQSETSPFALNKIR